ncbi:MAG TPA: HEAT repeat domain-containing protein [Anaerolineales bacterium]|nr:HEAT repeat domain-containing protein [Anaerolineales bacterium]
MFTKRNRNLIIRIISGLTLFSFFILFWISSYNEIGWNLFGFICPLAIVIAFGLVVFYTTRDTTIKPQTDSQVSSEQSANQVVQPQKTESVSQVTTAPQIISKQVQLLITELQSGNVKQRRSASYKLGKSQDPAAVSVLIGAFNDSDSIVRNNVIEGLRKIGSGEATAFLESHKILSKSSHQYDQLEYQEVSILGNSLHIRCPTCGKSHDVEVQDFKTILTNAIKTKGQITNSSIKYSGESIQHLNRARLIIIEVVLVLIGVWAAFRVGNFLYGIVVLVLVIGFLEGPLRNIFSTRVPILLRQCPECGTLIPVATNGKVYAVGSA